MDPKRFTESMLGRLVRIDAPRPDHAFIPEPLNPSWGLSQDLWRLLVNARAALAKLDGVGQHMPNHQLLLRPLQGREALRSSSLEGTYATPEELLAYQIDPREPSSRDDPVNSWREVLNYNKALDLGTKLLQEGLPLSLRLIRQVHEQLLSGVRGENRTPGEFRCRQVQIGVEARFVPPPPQEMQICLNDFERYLHTESEIDPLIRAFMAHYQFETIHPFLDGNGRVGRLLLSLTIYEWLKLGNPWLYMSAFFERHKDEYIDILFRVSTHGDWTRWLSFCLTGVVEQCTDAIGRFERLVKLRDDYHQRVATTGGAVRLNQLVDGLFEAPAVTVPQVAKRFEVTYPTAKSDITRLVRLGILREGPEMMYPKTFFAPAILDTAYRDEWPDNTR